MRISRAAYIAGLAALLASPSLAADMPVYQKTSAPVAVFNWTGFYAGVNAGYGWGRYKEELFAGGVSQGSETIGLEGGFVGGQIGANVQNGNIVWGVEADIQKSWISGTESWALPGFAITGTVDIDWFATVRGRVGITDGPSLFYLTGGVVHGEGTGTLTINGTTGTAKSDRTGWTAGAGYEAALGNNWSWKIEYLYLDFGKETANLGGGLSVENPINSHIVRLGANYRFGSY